MIRFLVLPRVRRSEFAFGIVDTKSGGEVANLNDEAAARWSAGLMNENATLDEERIARVLAATIGESRRQHAIAAVRARRFV